MSREHGCCYICDSEIDQEYTARDKFSGDSNVQIQCTECQQYVLNIRAQANLKNIKSAKLLSSKEIQILRKWIKENPNGIITTEVLRNELADAMEACEQKHGIIMA
jgi:hypothetical protein